MKNVRYAYALTGALLLGGAAASLTVQNPAIAQTAQNEPGTISAAPPRPGSPSSFADMVERLQPAVVNISTKQTIVQNQTANPFAGTPFAELFGQFNGGQQNAPPVRREGASLGSGFIISPDGYVVTNNHVIAPGARGASVDSITVTLPDRKEYTAKVIGRDAASDLALLKINASNLPFVRFGDSKSARVGDWVVAIGNPFGLGGTVTAGIVSAVHRVTGQGGANDRFIQTDASINQGNSGGPMFDLNGNVIGINSQIFSQSGGNIGIGFAIPAEDAKPIIDTLMKGGTVKRGYLGVGIQPVTDDIAAALGLPRNQGEIIGRVEPNGPGAKAGLKEGDVVTRINGNQVTPDQTLSYLVANVDPGTTARLDIIRNGRPQTVSATVGMRPPEDQIAATGTDNSFGTDDDDAPAAGDAAPGGSLGVSVQALTPQIARSIGVDSSVAGVVVARTDPSSDAGQKLRRGDVIASVNGAAVRTPEDLQRAVAAAKAANRPQVLLSIVRGRNPAAFVAVKIK